MFGETSPTALAGKAEPVTISAAMEIEAAAKQFVTTAATELLFWDDILSSLMRICNENEGIPMGRELLNGTKAVVTANNVRRIGTIYEGDWCFMIVDYPLYEKFLIQVGTYLELFLNFMYSTLEALSGAF